MPKKTGLGKGLDALFGSVPEEEQVKDNETVKSLKISEIEPNRDQPRKNFDQESLEELAESIKEFGLIQPIVVCKKDDYYSIVAGERRWRACKIAGIEEIPVLVRDDDEKKNQEIALIENIQREDLNPIDKALGFRQLLDEYGMTQQELSETVGIGRSTISNNLRILNLDERVQNLAREGKISEGHCRQLLNYEDPDKQYKMALKIIETGDSVRDIEQRVKNKKVIEKQNKKYEAIYRDIEDTFQNFFGTKVKLDAKQKSGKIIIKYTSNEELERILDLIRNEGNE